MLLTNHTRQIFIPMETMVGATLSYASDDYTKFYAKGEEPEGDERPRPVDVSIVGQNGILTFTERYGSMEKAKEAMDMCLLACANGQTCYAFPFDEEYDAYVKAERERKKKQAEQQRPAYQQEDPHA